MLPRALVLGPTVVQLRKPCAHASELPSPAPISSRAYGAENAYVAPSSQMRLQIFNRVLQLDELRSALAAFVNGTIE
jgi:hypothetical protein